MQTFVHYFLHLGLPLVLSVVFFRKEWKKAYLLFVATMLVDVDHLLADPIFQANRCSIQFHPLHTHYAMVVYVVLIFLKKPFRILGIGLLLHMLTDFIDCLFMYKACPPCFEHSSLLELFKLFWAVYRRTIRISYLPKHLPMRCTHLRIHENHIE